MSFIQQRKMSFRGRVPKRKGFTLVEIMIVVVIIGLLATMALPAFEKVQQNARVGRIAADFRAMMAAFETYAMENGFWPADGVEGVFPPEMEGYLLESLFTEPTVVGGFWDWEGPDVTGFAAITLRSPEMSEDLMLALDERLDDGLLDEGRYQRGVVAGNGYTLILD